MSKEALKDVTPQIDPQLTEKVKALKALVTCHTLLADGMFPKSSWGAIQNAQTFLESLHTQLTAECLAHPDCDKVTELQALKAPNGKS